MRYAPVVALVLVACSAILPVAHAADERPVEYNLAVIQRGSYVAPDDPLVFSLGTVLDSLGDRCQESRLQLGNTAVWSVDSLRKQGVYTETPLSMLQELDNAVVPDVFGPFHPANCTEFMAVLVVIVEGN